MTLEGSGTEARHIRKSAIREVLLEIVKCIDRSKLIDDKESDRDKSEARSIDPRLRREILSLNAFNDRQRCHRSHPMGHLSLSSYLKVTLFKLNKLEQRKAVVKMNKREALSIFQKDKIKIGWVIARSESIWRWGAVTTASNTAMSGETAPALTEVATAQSAEVALIARLPARRPLQGPRSRIRGMQGMPEHLEIAAFCKMTQFIQGMLQRSRVADTILEQLMCEARAQIVVINEPYRKKNISSWFYGRMCTASLGQNLVCLADSREMVMDPMMVTSGSDGQVTACRSPQRVSFP